MARTPEQKAADEALTAAIEACRDAYFQDEMKDDPDVPDGPGMTMEYLVIATATLVGDNGETYTRVYSLNKDDDVPVHRLVGLVEYTRMRYTKLVGDG